MTIYLGLILIFILIIIVLLIYIYSLKKSIYIILNQTKSLNQNDFKKIFVKNNSLLSQLALEINKIEERHKTSEVESKRIESANKELLTSLSHDVRTPLTSLLGYLDALNDNILNEDEKIHYINISRKKAYDLKQLVDKLFDWFKIDSSEMKLQPSVNDICELTRNILIDWLPIFEASNIKYVFDIPDCDITTLIDSQAYMRIINNIIQNSIEHSFCKKINICISSKQDIINLQISDNGVGLDEKHLNHIFDRLYKADSSRTKQSSGLGLCIAKQLTELMGGNISADSTLGKGLIFEITFPVIKND